MMNQEVGYRRRTCNGLSQIRTVCTCVVHTVLTTYRTPYRDFRSPPIWQRSRSNVPVMYYVRTDYGTMYVAILQASKKSNKKRVTEPTTKQAFSLFIFSGAKATAPGAGRKSYSLCKIGVNCKEAAGSMVETLNQRLPPAVGTTYCVTKPTNKRAVISSHLLGMIPYNSRAWKKKQIHFQLSLLAGVCGLAV